jgi:hypothetical protein
VPQQRYATPLPTPLKHADFIPDHRHAVKSHLGFFPPRGVQGSRVPTGRLRAGAVLCGPAAAPSQGINGKDRSENCNVTRG